MKNHIVEITKADEDALVDAVLSCSCGWEYPLARWAVTSGMPVDVYTGFTVAAKHLRSEHNAKKIQTRRRHGVHSVHDTVFYVYQTDHNPWANNE